MRVYVSVRATVAEETSFWVAECITHLDRWMTMNRLKLNVTRPSWSGSALGSSSPSSRWHNSKWLRQLSSSTQWSLTLASYCHTSRVHESANVCPYPIVFLPDASVTRHPTMFDRGRLRLLVQAFIHCRLDYCNTLLAGVADTQMKRVQYVQNTAACLVSAGFRCGADDRGPCVEMYPWRRTCLSTETMHTSGACSRTSSTVICVDWMCRAAKSVNVNRPTQFHLLWTHCTEQYRLHKMIDNNVVCSFLPSAVSVAVAMLCCRSTGSKR